MMVHSKVEAERMRMVCMVERMGWKLRAAAKDAGSLTDIEVGVVS